MRSGVADLSGGRLVQRENRLCVELLVAAGFQERVRDRVLALALEETAGDQALYDLRLAEQVGA